MIEMIRFHFVRFFSLKSDVIHTDWKRLLRTIYRTDSNQSELRLNDIEPYSDFCMDCYLNPTEIRELGDYLMERGLVRYSGKETKIVRGLTDKGYETARDYEFRTVDVKLNASLILLTSVLALATLINSAFAFTSQDLATESTVFGGLAIIGTLFLVALSMWKIPKVL